MIKDDPYMLRVYVMGRYSDDNVMDVLKNIRKGIKTSIEVLMIGCAPYDPWLDFMHILLMNDEQLSNLHKEIMYKYSCAWLRASHCALLLPERIEDSVGVQEWEMPIVHERGIPIFTDLEELKRYAELSRRVHITSIDPEVTPCTSPEQCSETETAG